MGKAIEGAAMLAGAVGLGALAFFDPAILATPGYTQAMFALALGGASMEAGAIAGALTSNRGMNITTRQAASFRQVIYGTQRVGGVTVYKSTTGSSKNQLNYVIVLATHVISSIEALYLDGRRVYFETGGQGSTTHGGTEFGGYANLSTYIGPDGNSYSFGNNVYCEACYGDQTNQPNTTPGGGYNTGLHANDPAWAPTENGLPYLGGCAYVYLKLEYSTSVFPNEPEIRFTVRGKEVYDPRTGTTAYSDNWALVVADVLQDPIYGVGDSAVNQAQLIAAANVCDEQVALAAGSTESRYSCHYHYDTSLAPGDVLSTMMGAAAGRLSRIGGEWYIFPAYYSGAALALDESFLTAKSQWKPTRPQRELFNVVTGTYIAANYPFNVSGNLYDSNGWYEGTIQNNFPYAFQPTNYPQYAADVLHGYASNEYLTQDLGIVLPKEIGQQCVLSVAQAQRLAKVYLLRNRQQGSGTMQMSLSAFQLQPCDTFTMSFAQRGWTDKLLEVAQVEFKLDSGDESRAPQITLMLNVQETDPSVYEWSVTEELSILDVPQVSINSSTVPVAPTSVTLTSSAATEVISTSGIVQPRIQVSWDTPLDTYATQIFIQYQLATDVGWTSGGAVDVSLNSAFISPVQIGSVYNVRICSSRPSGALSPFAEVDGHTVSGSATVITTVSLNPNAPSNTSDNSTIDSIDESGAATIRVYGPGGDGSSWTRYAGSATIIEPAAHITGNAYATGYYIVYDVFNNVFNALTSYLSTLNDDFYYLGFLTTCSATGSDGTGGGTGTGDGGTTGGGGRNPDPDQSPLATV